MMVALGVSGYGGHEGLGYMAGMFHLFTHAMFKALLFLGAGAIIHAVHSNEMSRMGGLRKQMPVTHVTFLIACLAIAGIPPFSGFFSKDEILAATFEFSTPLGLVESLTAGLTAFYMFRLYYNIFWATPASTSTSRTRLRDRWLLRWSFSRLLLAWQASSRSANSSAATARIISSISTGRSPGTSVAIALVAIGIATAFYRKYSPIPDRLERSFSGLHRAASHRFYIDEVYLFVTKKIIFNCISRSIAWFDRHVIDGAMDGLAYVTNRMSVAVRGLQSGQIQQYAFVFLLGTVVITVLVLVF